MSVESECIYTRTGMLVGDSGLEILKNSRVAVIGTGGVGAYAVEMLVRAGVGSIVAVDSDSVHTTNLNRQLIALESTLGRKKVDVLKERSLDINPDLDMVTIDEYLEESSLECLMERIGHIDFLIDAIDTLSPKLALIEYCVKNGIQIISSMGAGAKYDATKVRIADVSKSFNCPLAYIVRKKLRKRGISRGFDVVFSEELPVEEAIVPCEERNKKSQVGTISYLPAVFGCVAAQGALIHLLNK